MYKMLNDSNKNICYILIKYTVYSVTVMMKSYKLSQKKQNNKHLKQNRKWKNARKNDDMILNYDMNILGKNKNQKEKTS